MATKHHSDWNQFNGKTVPGTFTLQPVFFQHVRRGYAIVDIGCGAGRVCFDLLRRGYGPITGIDQNEHCVRFANEKLQDMALTNLKCQFLKRDALDTGQKDHSFDIGVMMAFLTTLTTPEIRLQALREARRIIRKNGGLYIGAFMQTWHHPTYYKRYVKGETETGEFGSFFAKDKSGTISFQAHHFSERELVDLIHEAGFQIKHWEYNLVSSQTGNVVNGAAIWVE